MEDCKPINTSVDYGVKLSKFEEDKVMDPTYKRLVGSLRYLTCTRSDILYGVGLLNHFMEEPKSIYWKAVKRILCYIRDTISHGLICSPYDFRLFDYSNNDWREDSDDRKSTI